MNTAVAEYRGEAASKTQNTLNTRWSKQASGRRRWRNWLPARSTRSAMLLLPMWATYLIG